MVWLWVVLIGFVIGLAARILMPGSNPAGFILTTLLGIVGSIFATWLGQATGIHQPGESARFIGSVIGAVLLLAVAHALQRRAY